MKKISRKQFLGALGSGTVVLWLQACGGGGGGYGDGGGGGGGGGGGAGGLSCGASTITNNHGHTLTIAWDRTGQKFGRGAGLSIDVDGQRVASAPDLRPLTTELP